MRVLHLHGPAGVRSHAHHTSMQPAAAVRAAALLQPLALRGLQQLAGPLSAAAASLHTQSTPSILLDKREEQQQQQSVSSSITTGFAARHASSGPPPTGSEVSTFEGENSWSKLRATSGFELKSSLGPAMYLMIGVFGFSMYVTDLIYQPPRVAAMLGLMMLLMYVRKI